MPDPGLIGGGEAAGAGERAPRLEDGCSPATPPGDNLANDFARGMAVAFAALSRARGDRVDLDPARGLVLTDGGSPSYFRNAAVSWAPLRDGAWADAVERLRAFYGAGPGGRFLLFSAWPTPDLGGAAGPGFELAGHPPLMLRPPGPVEARPVPGLEVRPVEDASGARDWEDAFVHGFPDEALQPFRPGCLLPEGGIGADGWRHWVGYLDGEPVGSAAAVVDDHHVHVEFIATLERARGRGIGRALTAVATEAAPLPALLIASDPGRPIYERLGYRSLLRYTLWIGDRPPR